VKVVEVQRVLSGPPERAFGLAIDLRGAPQRIRAIKRLEVLTEGPVREGTRFRETRVMFGKEATEEMEVVALDPPRAYELLAESHGSRYRTRLSFEPAAGGTRVSARFEAQPLTFVARALMAVLARPMLKACAKALHADLADIERALHEEPAPRAPAGGRAG
jgi:hypothetical protein